MIRIGILTFWNVPNYGAFMQAYALQKVLKNRFIDYDVRQIAYLNPKHYDVYYSKSVKNRYHYWIINPRFYRDWLKNKNREQEIEILKKFLEYYKKIPNFSCDSAEDLENINLDILILGSDIIWDYSVEFFGNDQFLFGQGINAHKKISYAPGFGLVKDGFDAPEYVKKSLKELDAISVRDEKSAMIVNNISGRKAQVVIDPTLLWDFENDENIVKPDESKYIVVYGSFFSDELIKAAKEYCKTNELKLICLSSLNDKFDWCDKVIGQDELNPFEWVGYFKYAHTVMTCTYHGLLFSLIFKKKIIFNMTNFILNKSESLIKELGLYSVLVEYKSFEDKINWPWDYAIIDKKLEKMREQSIEFLEEELKNGQWQ